LTNSASVVAADVNGDQRPDVLTASKLGSFLFINRGGSPKPSPRQ
jgi:hypothetical protein